mmetsp:Transcript_23793/g.42533  ORF Transcript_23793/g.42533 Transcript_23793/m.42533 type:complete len:201 (-) Transcript_23793:1306-1908(-)
MLPSSSSTESTGPRRFGASKACASDAPRPKAPRRTESVARATERPWPSPGRASHLCGARSTACRWLSSILSAYSTAAEPWKEKTSTLSAETGALSRDEEWDRARASEPKTLRALETGDSPGESPDSRGSLSRPGSTCSGGCALSWPPSGKPATCFPGLWHEAERRPEADALGLRSECRRGRDPGETGPPLSFSEERALLR